MKRIPQSRLHRLSPRIDLGLTQPREIASALVVMHSCVEFHSAIYLSAPVTTGLRLFRRRQRASRPSVRSVVSRNRVVSARIAATLRRSTSAVLIDPSAVTDLRGWTQNDYRHFWAEVIKTYVARVIFADGWEYSSGCCFEFLTAQGCGLPTLDERMRAISLRDGLERIKKAITDIRAWGGKADFLEILAARLEAMQQRLGRQPTRRGQVQ